MISKCVILLSLSALVVLLNGVEAKAGAFAVREQDTVASGDAFAGVAAGGSIGSMFWNPATMTQTGGGGLEVNGNIVVPTITENPTSGSTLAASPFYLGGANDMAAAVFLPSAYSVWHLTPDLWFGIAVNSPYGLQVDFPNAWAGRTYGLGTQLATYNATPSAAMRITDWLSFGVGVQFQYSKATFTDGLLLPPDNFIVKGAGMGFGYTAGLTIKPTSGTTVGVGLRSAIDQKIDGTLLVNAPLPATVGSVDSKIDLPNILSIGLRQRFDDRWTIMGTVEWTNWSRIGTTMVTLPSGAPATIAGLPLTLPFEYRDSWYYSLGAEYVWDAQTTLRAGLAFEQSPITDSVRMPLLPDNDRISLSAGLSYKLNSKIVVDASYLFVKVKDANINISAGSGNPWFVPPIAYAGETSSDISVFSLGLRYLFDTPNPSFKTKG
jgi:long-chain fatty acid transport protein